MSREVEAFNRRLLRARDAMDRGYAEPLNVRAVAEVACLSEAHFIRSFRAVFGETPHRYLQRRRVERSMFLLRETDRSVTDICFDVGFTSRGTFSRTFQEIIGESPSAYRLGHGPIDAPSCIQMAATRPMVAVGVAIAIQQFWRQSGEDGSVASGSSPSNLAKEKTSDDRKPERHVHLGSRQGRGTRLLRQQARAREGPGLQAG